MYTRLINGMIMALTFGGTVAFMVCVCVSVKAGLIAWAISFLLGMCIGPQKKKR